MIKVPTVGPDTDPKRSIARRLGAEVSAEVTDPSQARLLSYHGLPVGDFCAMDVLMPRRRPWWAFWRPLWSYEAWFVVGRGASWQFAEADCDGDKAWCWVSRGERPSRRDAAVLAQLWLRRKTLVEGR